MIKIPLNFSQKSSAIFGYLWKSSVTFRNFQKIFTNVRVAFVQLFKSPRKFWKLVKNLWKVIKNIIISNTWLLVDMKFLFMCSY